MRDIAMSATSPELAIRTITEAAWPLNATRLSVTAPDGEEIFVSARAADDSAEYG